MHHETLIAEIERYKKLDPDILHITGSQHKLNGRHVTVVDIERRATAHALYRIRVQGVALCNPVDNFEANTGMRIALRRAWRKCRKYARGLRLAST